MNREQAKSIFPDFFEKKSQEIFQLKGSTQNSHYANISLQTSVLPTALVSPPGPICTRAQ